MEFATKLKPLDISDDINRKKFGIFITEVETKTRFWFHRKGANYHKALDELNNKMDECYNNPLEVKSKVVIDQITPGLAVAAKFQDSGFIETFNRGIIRGLDRVNNTANIFFCDYGTSSDVKISEVRRLYQKFGDLPMQALQGRLWGLEENETDNKGYNQVFERVGNNKQGYNAELKYADALDLLKQPLALYLHSIDTEQCFNKVLVKLGITSWTSEYYENANTLVNKDLFIKKDLLKYLKSKFLLESNMFRFFDEKEKRVTSEIFKDLREDNSVSSISSKNTSPLLLGELPNVGDVEDKNKNQECVWKDLKVIWVDAPQDNNEDLDSVINAIEQKRAKNSDQSSEQVKEKSDERAATGVNVNVDIKHTKLMEKPEVKSNFGSGNVQTPVIESKNKFVDKKFERTAEHKSDKTSVHKSNTKPKKPSYEKSRKLYVPDSNNNSVERPDMKSGLISNISLKKKSSSRYDINSNIKPKKKSCVTFRIEGKSEIKAESKSDIKSAVKADNKTVGNSYSKNDTKILAKSDIKPVTKSDIKNLAISEIKSITKSDIKSMNNSDIKSMNNFDFKTMSKCIKSILKSDLKSGTDTGNKSDGRNKPITSLDKKDIIKTAKKYTTTLDGLEIETFEETEAFEVDSQPWDKSRLKETVSTETADLVVAENKEEQNSVLANANEPNLVSHKNSSELEQNVFIEDVDIIQGKEEDVNLKVRETPGFNEILNHQKLRMNTIYFFKVEESLLIPFVYGWGGVWMHSLHISKMVKQWGGKNILSKMIDAANLTTSLSSTLAYKSLHDQHLNFLVNNILAPCKQEEANDVLYSMRDLPFIFGYFINDKEDKMSKIQLTQDVVRLCQSNTYTK